jgi:hypothetical protein
LQPVLEAMELAKMTDNKSRERPREWIVRLVQQNNTD